MIESRFEKFKNYREQIRNQNELTKIFATENDIVTEYKNEINALNPHILDDLEPIHLNFLTFILSDKSSHKEITEVRNFINSFDFASLSKIREAANSIICHSPHDLTEEFKKNWVLDDRGWSILNGNEAFSEKYINEYIELKEKLPESVKKLQTLIHQAVNSKELEELAQNPIKSTKDNAELYKKKIYFFVLGALLVAGIASLIISILMLAIK